MWLKQNFFTQGSPPHAYGSDCKFGVSSEMPSPFKVLWFSSNISSLVLPSSTVSKFSRAQRNCDMGTYFAVRKTPAISQSLCRCFGYKSTGMPHKGLGNRFCYFLYNWKSKDWEKVKDKVKVIGKWFPCTHLTWIQYSTFHMMPWILPGVIPKHKARSTSWREQKT